MGMMHLALSAKSKTLENENIEGKSFTKILPCDTLETTGKLGEVYRLSNTHILNSVWQVKISSQPKPDITKFLELEKKLITIAST